MSRNDNAQMMLSDDLDCKMILENSDVRVLFDGSDERSLYLRPRIILVMEDTELGMSPFLMQIKLPVRILVELHAPFDQLLDLPGRFAHYLFHGSPVAEPVAGYHGILNVFLEIIDLQIRNRSDTPLSEERIRLLQARLADEGDLPVVSHLQGKAHAGDAGAYYQKVKSLYHLAMLILMYIFCLSVCKGRK